MTPEIKIDPLPMKAAQRFWRKKIKLSPGEFDKLADEAKHRAFAVGGIAKGSELTTVFNALDKAISKGTTFEEFKQDCGSIFARRGWTGKAAWRVDNIFRTNLQTAYNVGRYHEMMEVKKSRPFWQYSAINDSRTRPTHIAVNGKIYRADHAFWDTWYPPNGFRCRCGVYTLSEREVKQRGLKVEDKDITGTLVEPTDPVSGNRVPARLLMPDPGFSHHPGKAAFDGIVDSAVKPGLPKPLEGLRKAADYKRKALKNIRPSEIADLDETKFLPKGKKDEFYQQEFIKLYGKEKLIEDAAKEPVILSLRAFMANKAKKTWKFSKPGHGESIPVAEEMLKSPYEIWLTPMRDNAGRIRLAKRYISLWKTEDKKRIGGIAVYEVIEGVLVGVTNFLPLKGKIPDLNYLEKQRIGLLLYTKGR